MTPLANKTSDIYHDIYDFSLFPVSLGDILTWGVKSALRAQTVGRDKVHIHLIVDPQKSGFSPLQSNSYLVELFVTEALPIFYSHPLFSGLSIYRDRDEFRATFVKVTKGDETSLNLFHEHESIFEDKKNYDRLGKYFRNLCSYHEEINKSYQETGSYPKVGFLGDCLVDWLALQSQFPKGTFWVTVQFRLRQLDSGMPVSEEGWQRDAPFLTWYNFITEAQMRHPSVRFLVLGRLQEKPLELLRLSNVITLRALGMNLGHEITALLHSDLYMGSPSGFAQAAHFSDVPYDVLNCTKGGCEHYGIPFGVERLPIAGRRQRLHYGIEETKTLLECLERAVEESGRKTILPGTFEVNRVSSTDRFFTHDSQSSAELTTIFTSRLKATVIQVERGDLLQARKDLDGLQETFPEFASKWSDFQWLSHAINTLLTGDDPAKLTLAWRNKHKELLADLSRFCHPNRLIRRSGRYFDNLFRSQGFQNHGWCERQTKLWLAPSDQGDFLMIQIARLGGDDPVRLNVTINEQKPVPFVILNEYALLEVPVQEFCVPTEITLKADRSWKRSSRDDKKYSYQIEGAALISKQISMPSSYRGDKSDPRDKIVAGIHANGEASSLVHIRIDNPFAENRDVSVHVIGMIPRSLRRGQMFRIRINDGPEHETFLRGKHFEALIPCPGHPRHVSVSMEFIDQASSESAQEKRAMIKRIDIVSKHLGGPIFKTGFGGLWSHLLRRKVK